MNHTFFKHVKTLDCIFCNTKYPLKELDFRTMNRHGWGCCSSCWQLDMPNHTGVYVPPTVLAHIAAKRKTNAALNNQKK